MDIFDKIGEKVSQTSKLVKLNGLISDEESQIASCYQQMGKLCFEKYSENPDSSIADLVSQVKNAELKINEYSEQIKKLRGFSTCSQCGADIHPGNLFCVGCGAKVENVQTTSVSDVKVCISCGASVAEDMAFCTSCGQKIEI